MVLKKLLFRKGNKCHILYALTVNVRLYINVSEGISSV